MRCENKTFLQNDPGFLQEISSTAVEVGLGFLGHFFSARWGWLLGAIPAAAGLAVMMVGSWVSLIRESKHSLRSPPPCQAGKCTARRMVSLQVSRSKRFFGCGGG